MVAYRSEHRVGAVDTSVAPVPCPGFEISQKQILVRNLKMVVYRSVHIVGTVDTSDAPEFRPKIEISQNFFEPKNENGRIQFKAHCRCR